MEVLEANGYRIPEGTYRKGESGERSPSATAAQALAAFLQVHPAIPNPQVYRQRPGPKPEWRPPQGPG